MKRMFGNLLGDMNFVLVNMYCFKKLVVFWKFGEGEDRVFGIGLVA